MLGVLADLPLFMNTVSFVSEKSENMVFVLILYLKWEIFGVLWCST